MSSSGCLIPIPCKKEKKEKKKRKPETVTKWEIRLQIPK